MLTATAILKDILKHDGGAYNLEPRQSKMIMNFLKRKPKVVIEVLDGVAECTQNKTGFIVDIIDHDNQGG